MIRTPDFSQAHDDIVAFVRSHANEQGYLKTVTRELDSPYAVMYIPDFWYQGSRELHRGMHQ